MTIRNFLIGIGISTLACFLVWLAVILLSDPAKAGLGGMVLFYFSLFLWLFGALIFAGFYLRFYLISRKTPFAILSGSVRQAFIFALVASAALILKSGEMLNWTSVGILIILAIGIELYYIKSNHEHSGRIR